MSGSSTINDYCVGASTLAMDIRAPLGVRHTASSLTTIASLPQAGTRSYKSSPALINPSLNCSAANRAYNALLAISS